VILKILRDPRPDPLDVERLRNEAEILGDLDIPGTPLCFGVEEQQRRLALVLEDEGALALDRVLERGPLDLDAFFAIALDLTATLGELHARFIIHKDIKPANVIIHPEDLRARFVDFGIATRLSREFPSVESLNTLQGTLAYISPEQTGRMNRAMDYRSDFYSLGVTYYEMLCGERPFQTSDMMEMIHNHMAVTPPLPHAKNTRVPEALSAVVMKLMAKNPEDRYQSAYGLTRDLQECRDRLHEGGGPRDFTPGLQDVSDRFLIPEHLYGRDREIEGLLESFEGMRERHRSVLMLVRGYSGIGKTALVREIYKPIVAARGYFISGKFDQFGRDIPYATLIQAFRDLLRQILSENEASITAWKERLTNALGSRGGVITNVIPELEHIIGVQADVPPLGPRETQDRFRRTFLAFVGVFAGEEHPLALFLDDLQWADMPSLELIRELTTDIDIRHLFLIGAYRDNEVADDHPLMLELDRVRKSGGMISETHLGPLPREAVLRLIGDTLRAEPERIEALCELVLQRTRGNPFFVTQFLTTLYKEGVFNFDAVSGQWQWDMSAIQAMGITDNVVELMADRVRTLSPEGQFVLHNWRPVLATASTWPRWNSSATDPKFIPRGNSCPPPRRDWSSWTVRVFASCTTACNRRPTRSFPKTNAGRPIWPSVA
jgi:serine/threonine protein kinase